MKCEKINEKMAGLIKKHLEAISINQQMATELLDMAREYERKPTDKWRFDYSKMEWFPIAEKQKGERND